MNKEQDIELLNTKEIATINFKIGFDTGKAQAINQFKEKLIDEIDTTFSLIYGDIIAGKYTIKRKLDLERFIEKTAEEILNPKQEKKE
jgi:hypothetical protein